LHHVFPDLAHECAIASGPAVRAVGWLEHGKPFPVGTLDEKFVATLKAHVGDTRRWLPFAVAGPHFCDLGGCERTAGSQNVIFPGETCVYVAPEMIVHYVEAHPYAPPREFIAAVLACPEQSSDDYVAKLLPFGSTWGLAEASVHSIAARAREHRKRAAEHAANKGGFKW
jgi:hypothetical protein